jgi:phosphatidate cytidylyltransferase
LSNFLKRTLTGTIFVVVMIGGIFWNQYSFEVLFFLIAMLGLDEFYKLLIKAGYDPHHKLGLLCGATIFFLITISKLIGESAVLYLSFALIATIFLTELYRNKQKPFQNISYSLLGIIYVVLPFALWVNFTKDYSYQMGGKYNPHLLLGFFFLLWTNDTGAYIVGMSIGKHKLWERISPKKTWEGFFGGVILAMGIGYVISLFYPELNYMLWMIMGLIIGVFGTLGDLVESAFKRSLDVKDSGSILPGHGGILDRFDAVLLATPFVLVLLQLVMTVQLMTE